MVLEFFQDLEDKKDIVINRSDKSTFLSNKLDYMVLSDCKQLSLGGSPRTIWVKKGIDKEYIKNYVNNYLKKDKK